MPNTKKTGNIAGRDNFRPTALVLLATAFEFNPEGIGFTK